MDTLTGRQRTVITVVLLVGAIVLYVVGKDVGAGCLMGLAAGQFGPAGLRRIATRASVPPSAP